MPPTEHCASAIHGFDGGQVDMPARPRPELQTKDLLQGSSSMLSTPSTVVDPSSGSEDGFDDASFLPLDQSPRSDLHQLTSIRVCDSSARAHWQSGENRDKVLLAQPATQTAPGISILDDDNLGLVLQDAPFFCRRVCRQWHVLIYAHLLRLVAPRSPEQESSTVSRFASVLLKRDLYGHALFRQLAQVRIGGEIPIGLSQEAQELLAQSSSIETFELNKAALPVLELNGKRAKANVDLSNLPLTMHDAALVGSLVQGNSNIQSLKVSTQPALPVQDLRKGRDKKGDRKSVV